MKREDVLANCIVEIQAGKRTLEDCLAEYPDLSDELRPLLNIATSIQPERATPSPEFKQRARNRLLETMQASAAYTKYRWPGIFEWFKPLVPAKGLRFSMIVAIVLAIVVVAGGTTVYASQKSLPDDALYPVKTGVENIQLALTLSPAARASLNLELAQRRTEEVLAQSSLGRNMSTSALEAVALRIDCAIREMGSMLPEDTKILLSQLSELTVNQEIKLGQALETAPDDTQPALKQALGAIRRGNLIAQVAYSNTAFLSSSPSVLDEELEAAYFELEGTLLSAEGETWNIGGVLIENVNLSQETPPVGSRVEIEGLVRGNEVFISKIEHEEKTENQVKIEGVFRGTNAEGTIWYVGGIAISKPQNVMPPLEGNHLEIVGTIQNGIFIVSEMESEEGEKVEIKGILVELHLSKKTIVIEVAGAQVTINVSEALIKSEDGQPLKLFDLESLIGEAITVHDLHMVDGLLYAQEVYVEVEQEPRPAGEDQGQEQYPEENQYGDEKEEIENGEDEEGRSEGDDNEEEEGRSEGEEEDDDDEEGKDEDEEDRGDD